MLAPFGTLYIAAELFEVGEHAGEPVFAALGSLWLVLFQVPRLRTAVFGAFLLTSTTRLVLDAPDLPNHSNAYLFTHVVLLGLWLRAAVARRPFAEQLASWEDFLRGVIATVYFAAAFHKLNWGFLDPEPSCANHMMRRLAEIWHLPDALPAALATPSPLLAVLWEGLAPLLLVLRRAQPLGVLLALGMHALFAQIAFVDFSSLGLALLYLYLPADVRRAAYEPDEGTTRATWAYAVVALLYPLASEMMESVLQLDSHLVRAIQGGVFTAAAITFLAPGVAQLVRTRRWEPAPVASLLRHPAKLALIVALLAFAASPYIGLRTGGTFSMFSNLIIWEPRANHLLVPTSLKLFDHADDLVWFESVDARIRGDHKGAPRRGYGLPVIEFKKLVRSWRDEGIQDVRLRFRYDGEMQIHQDITTDDEWTELPWWQANLLDFRQVQAKGPNRCRW